MENEDVFTLPKLGPRAHSSLSGVLSKYQNDMSTQFLCIVGKLQSQIKEISKRCIQNLDNNMKQFQEKKNNIINQQNNIIESMSTTHEQFDSIKTNLLNLKDQLFNELNLLKNESLKIYQNSYQETAPFISEARKNSELIIPQIPKGISDRLENEISRFNSNFIQNKQGLIRSFYNIKIDVTKQQNQLLKEFQERKESWNINHFQRLIQTAKDKFNLTSPIDYNSIYQHFYTDQQKFNNCFQKALTNISLIIPPDHLSHSDLDQWWKQVEDLLDLHSNFIHKFITSIQTTLNENIEENNRMMSSLEKEFFELTDSNEAQNTLDELNKMKKAFEIINSSFVETVKKYWEYRKSCLVKCFESIKDFYMRTIEVYDGYSTALKERETKQNEEKALIEANSKESIEKLEMELKEEMGKIELSTTEKEIDLQSKKCSKFLSLIENEYRNTYKKLISLFDEQPSLVTKLFQTYEPKVLEVFNLKLLNGLSEFTQTIPTNRKKESNRNSTRTERSANSRNGRRTSRGVTASISEEIHEQINFNSGPQCEVTKKFNIIPPFENFPIVEVPQTTGKGNKSPMKNKQAKKPQVKSQKSKNSSQDNEYNIYIEEPESIEFDLNDVVPKIDDLIAIWIPVPTMNDLNEWIDKYRIAFVNDFYNHSKLCLNVSMNEELKMIATDQLNENLRVLNPSDGLIQINVVEARKIKLTSQKDQIALHFRRITQQFNSAIAKIKYNLSINEKQIFDQYEKEKQMITEISSQKTVRLLKEHNLYYTAFDTKAETDKENILQNQESSMNELLNVFKTKNEHFKQVLFGKDDNNQESKIIINYLNKMDEQMNEIKEKFDLELSTLKTQADTLHDQIHDEFNSTYEFNLIDLTFLETISLYQSEFKHQYETLSIVNKSREIELDNLLNSIDSLITSTKESNDNEGQTLLLLNKLELLRVKIMKRCIYLNHLKSTIDQEPTLINFSYNEITQESETQETQKKQNAKPQKNSKLKPTPNDQKVQNADDNYQKRIDKLKTEFKDKLTRLSNDYYAQFKTRKVPITRPDDIPINHSLFLEKITNSWKDMTSEKEFQALFDDSIVKLRFQVSKSLTEANELISCIFKHFLMVYLKRVENESKPIHDEFNSKLKILRNEREKNQSFLTPNLSDTNKNTEFDQLIKKEQIRTKNEEDLTKEIGRNIAMIETKHAQDFLEKLPNLVSIILEILDKFVLIEDLNQGPNPNLKRKTLKSLLKDKQRQADDPSYLTNERPFNFRNWPDNPPKFTSLFNFDAVQEIIRSENEPQIKSSQKTSKDKKRANKNSSRKSSRKTDPLFRPDSQHPSARKNIPSKQSARQEVDGELSSYETPVHRSTIIQRNRAFSNYNNELYNRAIQFNNYIGSIKSNTKSYVRYWNQSIRSFRPSYKSKLNPLDDI